MIEYELQKAHTAELLRQAGRERLLQEARAARREARRTARNDTEGRVSPLRERFTHAA